MNRHEIRYLFEHRLLPNWFFQDKDRFVGILLNDKKILYGIIDDIFKKEEVENPYKEEDFSIEAGKITEDIIMVKIVFPEPEDEPLCYCSYLFFDINFEKTEYFCIERGNEHSEEYPFVCGWTSDGSHCNFGNCTFEENGDFLRCLEIYMKKYYESAEKE